MKSINLRLVLLVAFCGVATLSVLWPFAGPDRVMALESETEQASSALGIGSPAPKLDIEHWIQDGQGFFKPVTEFKPGTVYVVEFWATWCPPCVASMPHLADLQQRYRGQNVQIISISDEPLETVEAFLKRKTDGPDGEETTFQQITAAYSLTTDPDRSTHEAYMEAAEQGGIPTAFLVGKDGVIEWIGHPMELDEPLEQVVSGKWNRQEFAEVYAAKRDLPKLIRQVNLLASRDQLPEAIELIEGQLKKKQPEEIRVQLLAFKQQLKMYAGAVDEEVVKHFKQQFDAAEGNALTVARLALPLSEVADDQDDAGAQPGIRQIIGMAIDAVKREVDGADADLQPLLHHTLARLQRSSGDLNAAITSQQTAVENATGATKDRMERFLKQLQEEQSGNKD